MYSTCIYILSHFARLEKAKHPQTWMGDKSIHCHIVGYKNLKFFKKVKNFNCRLLHFIKVQTMRVFAQTDTYIIK